MEPGWPLCTLSKVKKLEGFFKSCFKRFVGEEGGDLWSREHLDFIRSPSQSGFYLLNPESNRNEPTSKV